MRVLFVAAGVMALLMCASAAHAESIPLGNYSNNTGIGDTISDFFSLEVTEGTGAYDGYVCFEFSNDYDGTDLGLGIDDDDMNIAITDVYFADPSDRLDVTDYILPTNWDTPATPNGVPGNIWTTDFSADADNPQQGPQGNGIAAGESGVFYLALESGETFEDYLGDIGILSGDARIGFKVQGIGDYSETIVNVPEPASLALLGLGLAGAAGVRARRRRMTR